MITLKIKRFKEIVDGTIGKFCLLSSENVELLSGYTLEPAGEDTLKAGQDKRIPQGRYHATWKIYSPKFKRHLPTLFNDEVNKARRILIHSGNIPDHTSGCILLGGNYTNGGVWNSRDTFAKFEAIVKRDDFIVEIENEL